MANILKRFIKDFTDINDYYNYLVNKTKNREYVGITNEWLIDNFYLLVEHKQAIMLDKKEIKKNLKTIIKVYPILKEIVIKHNFNISFKILVDEVKNYQKHNNTYFTYKDLDCIKPALVFLYTERLNNLCLSEYSKLVDKENITDIIKSKNKDNIELSDFIGSDYVSNNGNYYVYELNSRINDLGDRSSVLFKGLNEFLEERGLSLKEIINNEHQERMENDLLISNIFNDFKEFFEFSNVDLYEKISRTEKLFLKDEYYGEMDDASKELYRKRLLNLSKRHHTDELTYLEKITSNSDRHVGFALFKRRDKKFRVLLYVLTFFVVSVVISYFLSMWFIKPRWLGFIIILIPVSQLFLQIYNQVLIRIVKAYVLPKLDFTDGIPNDSRTMVVIPTIVSNKDKIKEMFDTLETFYIINKSDNLYFTLLGDVKASSNEVEDYDEELTKYGKEYAEKLNKKYHKELFFYIYRKRLWNEGEGQYLGYERKRGALIHFNKVLLGQKFDEDKYFNINTLKDNRLGIKYVITLDTDTRLVLNTALNLVGCMAHPLNRPVLNKEGTKVIRGYGLMQPRVSVDIEATNKSLYSQIFAGIGGFDTYSAIVPNVYQDNFREGSFVGKGIYDLETFDKVLGDTFPENLILSHDLLEGNYIRCGYVSDIELIDDFPSKFLTDVTRQHRWARGDVQIISWLGRKVRNAKGKKVKNPINLLGKYKIFDNIVRMFLPLGLLLILLCSTFISKQPYIWFLFVILEIAVPILFFLYGKRYNTNRERQTVYYKNLVFGSKSILFRSYIVFATLPYYSKMYLDAFFRTLYRLFISHKNLLNWITAEDAEKAQKNTLGSYCRNFLLNLILGVILLVVGIIFINVYSIILGLVFISAPFIMYFVSRDIDLKTPELKDKKLDSLREMARRTWKYFGDNLNEKNNYLIPDNYQENREDKLDKRTSPTALGFSLTSVVAAYELEFINRDEAVSLLGNILESVDSLEKWNGHLYNWYDIQTKKVMQPYFVSTVDSGNFVASVVIAREFLETQAEDKLVKLCDKLIKNANFKKLYTKKDVFSIGYDANEGKLSIYNYNKFASESRLTSYLSIAFGYVPNKHWFSLDKSLTLYKKHKGLISWSGTSFEYYMPLLYMKNYPNTLLDESYHFAHFCQKEYINSVSHKLPWGISESAYNELDNALNYKYKAFATPYLKAKEDMDNRIVLSPYSSLMALELFPEDVYDNLLKFKDLDMYSEYGFYEAYDYDNKGVVYSYFAHHQGMCLMGFANYLKPDCVKEYFHKNVNIKTFDILLKEKVQVQTSIDLKMASYKKYDYKKENIENDIRSFGYISYLPEVSVLSNKKYMLLMNDRGNSFSRYRTLQLNRYRKVTEQDYGIFMFIKNLKNNYIWSNTYAPMNVNPDKYEVVFSADKIKYIRRDQDITTTTEIVVSSGYHAEIRKVTFKNDSDSEKKLELTTYTEPILSENMDDVSHKVFNNLFVSTEFDKNTNTLIAKRKGRGENNVNSYMFTRLLIPEEETIFTYETERARFIGRNHNLNDALALSNELSNYAGENIDPVMSLRSNITVPANGRISVYLVVGFGRSREQIDSIVAAYDSAEKIKKAYRLANLMNVVNVKNMNLTGKEMRTFNIMLNYLYQTTKISVSEERNALLRRNALGQNGLWKFGISGDRPIILVEINDISDMGFIYEILKAFEYYKNSSVFVDVVIINNENEEYSKVINKVIEEEKYRMYTVNSFYHTPGGIYVIDSSDITSEEKRLFDIVPRIRFNLLSRQSLEEAVLELQEDNKINDYPIRENEDNIQMNNKERITCDNGYGGFKNNGREYVIYNKDTPMPWSNVIANKNFGTIVTNNGNGFTYGFNSSEFKITSWSNEMIVDDKSEGFKFNGRMFNPEKCTHGYGYSVLESETHEFVHEVTEFVPLDDTVKIYLMKIKNKLKTDKDVDINFFINPTFGNFEEKTSRHILTEFMGDDNYLKMRNVYHNYYSDLVVFMSSSLKINSATIDKILVKDINSSIHLAGGEEKVISFVLGCGYKDRENVDLVNKYSDINTCKKSLKEVKDYWNNLLGTFEIKSPDNTFNYVMNGWYLYQTIAARILAKSGYYQVSGAFGFRDQLQDTMNVAMVLPEVTRNQILINASHQFIEGDVLHWWHEVNRFGLRSRFKDDYLWLVYATYQYIITTNDYSILDEVVPYIEGEKLSDYEPEKGMVFNYSKEEDTLMNHLIKALELSMNSLGRHKIPLMGGGDWNDGMNKVGIKGKGESVWLAFFLYQNIEMFMSMMKRYDKSFDLDKYDKFNIKLKDNINKKCWDGEYYLRAFFDNGDKLGSHENTECKIDLISQSFSILSGVAPKDRVQSVISSVEEKLVDEDNGIIKLLTPAFSKSLNNPGYIMNYPQGIRENGGQYTHSVAWYLMALIRTGYYDRAYRYFQMINPATRAVSPETVKKYKVEPYVIAADIYSSATRAGRGGWTWYTGSAGWFYRVGLEEILGIKKRGNKLKVDPNIPISWDGYKATYHYLDTTYNIEVVKSRKESTTLDGREVTNNTITLNDDKGIHSIIVYANK